MLKRDPSALSRPYNINCRNLNQGLQGRIRYASGRNDAT